MLTLLASEGIEQKKLIKPSKAEIWISNHPWRTDINTATTGFCINQALKAAVREQYT
jgi:hypothetical protein